MKWLRIFEKKKSIYSKIVLNYIFSRLQKILKTNNVISGDINYTNECKSLQNLKCVKSKHYIKSVRIRSVSGRHFLAFGLNTEVYSVNLRIQSEYGKMQTRKAPKTESYHAVNVTTWNPQFSKTARCIFLYSHFHLFVTFFIYVSLFYFYFFILFFIFSLISFLQIR